MNLRLTIPAACLLVFGLALAACAAEKITIGGQVVDDKGGVVPGATVYLYRISQYDFMLGEDKDYLEERTTTGRDGRFSLVCAPFSPDSIPVLTAAKRGLSFGGFYLAPKRGVADMRIVLTEPAAISGVVVDKNGRMVKGVRVSGYAMCDERGTSTILTDKKRGILYAVTGDDGKFELSGLPKNARLSLVLEADGYARLRVSGSGQTLDSHFPVKAGASDLRFELAREGTIRGAVVDPASGKKNRQIVLYCYSPGSMSGLPLMFRAAYDFKGDFCFKGLPAGSYTIGAACEGGYAVTDKKGLVVTEGGCLENVRLDLTATGWVAGKVTDTETGKPMAGVRVMASSGFLPSASSVYSDADGTFKLALPPGETQVGCYPSGGYQYQPARKITIVSGETVSGFDFTFTPPGKVHGTVVDEQGKPVSGADVKMLTHWGGDGLKTDAQGRFEVTAQRGMPNETVNYIIARDAMTGRSGLAEAPSGSEKTGVTVVLRPSGIIKGRIENKKGEILPGATIQCFIRFSRSAMTVAATGSESGWSALTLDPAANFTVAVPADNKYEIQCSAAGYGMERKGDISLKPGQTYDCGVIIVREANSFMAGRLVDEDDNPVAGANISVQGDGQQYRNATSLADGTFRIDGLVEGKVGVNAYLPTPPGAYGYLREVQTGRTDVELVMQSRQPGGPSRDVTGKPAPALAARQYLDVNAEDIKFGHGRVFVLVSLSCYSPSTRRALPALNALAEKYRNKPVMIVGLADDSVPPEEMRKLLDSGTVKFPVVFSEPKPRSQFGLKVYSDFGIDTIPQALIVDKQGIVRSSRVAPDDLAAKIDSFLQ